MNASNLEFLINNALGAVGLGIVAFLANKWIDSLEDKIKISNGHLESRISDIESRITSVEEKYRDVLDIVLQKFSNWEDRVSSILVKIKESSPEEIKNEIEIFRNQTQNDILNMKLEVKKVSEEIATSNIVVDQKELLTKKVNEIHGELVKRIQDSEKRISLAIKMISHLNEKTKAHEFKISNLSSSRKI